MEAQRGRDRFTYNFSGNVWRPSFGSLFASEDLLWSTKREPLINGSWLLVKIKMMIFSFTLPGAFNKVGFGHDVVLWGDFLAQNYISQQRLHTYNLKGTESWKISTETKHSCIFKFHISGFHCRHSLPETVNCWRCRAAGWWPHTPAGWERAAVARGCCECVEAAVRWWGPPSPRGHGPAGQTPDLRCLLRCFNPQVSDSIKS